MSEQIIVKKLENYFNDFSTKSAWTALVYFHEENSFHLFTGSDDDQKEEMQFLFIKAIKHMLPHYKHEPDRLTRKIKKIISPSIVTCILFLGLPATGDAMIEIISNVSSKKEDILDILDKYIDDHLS